MRTPSHASLRLSENRTKLDRTLRFPTLGVNRPPQLRPDSWSVRGRASRSDRSSRSSVESTVAPEGDTPRRRTRTVGPLSDLGADSLDSGLSCCVRVSTACCGTVARLWKSAAQTWPRGVAQPMGASMTEASCQHPSVLRVGPTAAPVAGQSPKCRRSGPFRARSVGTSLRRRSAAPRPVTCCFQSMRS
jgi:hypothetical protein